MSHHLPEGWQWVRLGDICEINPSRDRLNRSSGSLTSYLPMAAISEDASGINYVETRPYSELANGYTFFRSGDILFAKITPCMENGKVAIADELIDGIGFGSTEFHVLRPGEMVDTYLVFSLVADTHFRQLATRYFTGSAGQQRVSEEFLISYLFPLPPLDEQRRIAAVLRDADTSIARVEDSIAAAQAVKRGVMRRLFTYGLGDESTPTKHTEVGETPKHWLIEPLEKHTASSMFGPRFPANAYNDQGNVATLRTTDLDDEGNIHYETMPLAELDLKAFESHLLQPGDMTITRSGTIGIASVFQDYRIPVLPGAFLIRFRLQASVTSDYLRQYFNSDIGRNRVLSIAAGGVQKNLQGSAMLRLHVPVPPIGEQREIAAILQTHDDAIRALQAERERLRAVKRGLMQGLLSGEIRTSP